MYNSFSSSIDPIRRFFTVFLIAALLAPAMPPSAAIAQETSTSTDDGTTQAETVPGCTDELALNYDPNATEDDGTCTYAEETASSSDETGDGENGTDGADGTTTDDSASTTDDGTASSTDDTTSTSTDDGTASSTDDGTGTSTDEITSTSTDDTTGTSTGDGTGGSDGDGTVDGESGTTTSTTTDETSDGSTGSDGTGGSDGTATTSVEASPEDGKDPVPVISGNEVGDGATPGDEEDVTGAVYQSSTGSTQITTGMATAHGELFSDVNSVDVKSEIEGDFSGDLDFYTFNATGTNDATVKNDGLIFALTGENTAEAANTADIVTGEAVAALNIANVVNSNVVNSDGFLFLKNQILEPNQSLDMRDLFFPDEEGTFAGAQECDLLTCVAEDIVYNNSQTNHATVTNNAHVEATTGANYADGNFAEIETGDAYAGANVINVVNSNIIDSNYRLLTFNAIGDLDGDLMLPREELWRAFFSRPNGISRVEHDEGLDSVKVNVDSDNDGTVNNDLDSYAETGLNLALTTIDDTIETGRAESESNVLSKVNETTYGGDSMYLLIRVHGEWSGEVRGLPAGLTWEWMPDGKSFVIYNKDAEIAPSEILPYDADTFTANFTEFNRMGINNNLKIDAVTGENEVAGNLGEITTGNAFASANVMNIANTNVVGTNWTFAVINILGDFDGNVTFKHTDLSLLGEFSAVDDPLHPNSTVSYSYTVTNNGDITATGVTLEQTLHNAYATGTDNTQSASLGTLAPGESKSVTMSAFVDPELATGTHTVKAVAHVNANEGDGDESDNTVLLDSTAVHTEATADDTAANDESDGGELDTGGNNSSGGGSSGGGGGSSGGGGGSSGGGGGGSGGGGGNSTKTKSIDRDENSLDPDDASHLVIQKVSSVDDDEVIKAGQPVDYTVTITNGGGNAYDAVVYDTLRNPIGSLVDEQSWELGTILAGEVIKLEYTTLYNEKTPSGTYTNTARIEAYKEEDGKEDGDEPLKLDEAVHTIEIDGIPLAVGNVETIAYYPAGNGTVNALLRWETNRPATGQVFYSPASWGSQYDPLLPNFGYQHASFKFNTPKSIHHMIIRNLVPGVVYAYKIRSTSGSLLAVGGDYTLSVPSVVSTLTLSTPRGPLPLVAGATYGSPSPAPTPGPAAPASIPAPTPRQNSVAQSNAAPPPAADPVPEPEPKPEPEPEPAPAPAKNDDGSFFKKAADTVMGFFGW